MGVAKCEPILPVKSLIYCNYVNQVTIPPYKNKALIQQDKCCLPVEGNIQPDGSFGQLQYPYYWTRQLRYRISIRLAYTLVSKPIPINLSEEPAHDVFLLFS